MEQRNKATHYGIKGETDAVNNNQAIMCTSEDFYAVDLPMFVSSFQLIFLVGEVKNMNKR
jgi:hypothetical protein